MSSYEVANANNEELEILLNRVKEYLKSDKDADVARALKVSPSSIPTWRKRGTVPYGDLVKFANENDLSLDWLFYGGPMDTEAATDLELGRMYPIDQELLAICIEAAEVLIKEMRVELPPKKHAQIISMLYKEYEDMDEPHIDGDKVVRLIRLAS